MVNRYRLPRKVGPSPAEGEPGVQNMASRIRSSHEDRKERLEGRATEPEATQEIATNEPAPSVSSSRSDSEASRVGPSAGSASSRRPARAPARRLKITILFRLPLDLVDRIRAIPGTASLGEDYVIKALAKVARAELRELEPGPDVEALTEVARQIHDCHPRDLSLGEPMTIYLAEPVLRAMHEALGDPWQVEPKATVVNAYVAALVARAAAARTV